MVYNDTHKFVAVVNKDMEIGKALNAIAHCCARLIASDSNEIKKKMSFIDFIDKDS